jgi:hypothetical protein
LYFPYNFSGGKMGLRVSQLSIISALLAATASAGPVFFSTGNPDGLIAVATRPDTVGKFEIEAGDDFVITSQTRFNSATFVGLVPAGATIGQVRLEIYRVFPADSDVTRTSGPPTFSTSMVPTRVNSPSDVEFLDRDTADSNLSVTTSVLLNSFSALNSVLPGGIHPTPGQTTGGNLGVSGQEVLFNLTFLTPIDLPADHYFFVPQVEVSGANNNFLWLSAPRPIVPPGTAFPPGTTDLQAWTRDEMLAPDWLRVGTDIVGGNPAPTFNLTFSLTGVEVPEPSTCIMLGTALLALGFIGRKKLPRG